MTDATTARRVSKRWPLISSVTAVVLVLALGGLIALRGNSALEFDAEWMDEIIENRNPWLEAPSLLMDFLGGHWFAFVLPLAGIVILIVRKKPWSALYLALASALSALLVQAIKLLFGRPRPEDQLVFIDSGSFPSGHTANAATLATVIFLLFPKLWVWALGVVWVALMLLSRTYLGVHWLSDTIGGVLLGVAVAVIIWAPLASRIQRERAS